MDDKQFREFGKAAIDYIADYNENLRDRDVLPDVQPGYLSKLIPHTAPEKPETWQQVLDDVERFIMPGVTHWNSPRFHAYYPTANSYPAIVGEIMSAGLGSIGFSWITSPACTELEMITMDWLGKLLGLPEKFLNSSPGYGGGVIQGTASEALLVALMAARETTVNRLMAEQDEMDEGAIRSKLIAYSSDQSNSSVEKGGRLGAMKMRLLPVDEQCSLRGSTFLEAVERDIKAGLIPCYAVITLGTTPTCAFDNLQEIGPICKKYNIWLHIDAAYAGAAFVCPEYQHLMAGIEYADSFNFNPHKWLLVNFDCSAFWVKDYRLLEESFNVDRIYLANNKQGNAYDYRHWQIPLGRRFRALKLWFVLRLYGAEGLRQYIRHTITLGKNFEELVRKDDRFEVLLEASMGLVCFRLRGEDHLTRQLLDRLMERRKIYVIPGGYQNKLCMRFVVCSRFTLQADIEFAWDEISSQASEILSTISQSNGSSVDHDVPSKITNGMTSKMKGLEMKNEQDRNTNKLM
ncbi:hypothetical protein QAD02_015266 [Eretmocerus hayati]|uniref:Uncharacterized protein n=1 Tax=Eretmocerus hayati TaxID=131215 RepID=A0ACC2P7B9_9HYME|nr:hypothetical protein QAD02_015266 [Eretmocerus hayati]